MNPIEFIWKSIKRVLSTSFVPNLAEMRRIITESFCRFAECKRYAGYWIEKFISKNKNYKTHADDYNVSHRYQVERGGAKKVHMFTGESATGKKLKALPSMDAAKIWKQM